MLISTLGVKWALGSISVTKVRRKHLLCQVDFTRVQAAAQDTGVSWTVEVQRHTKDSVLQSSSEVLMWSPGCSLIHPFGHQKLFISTGLSPVLFPTRHTDLEQSNSLFLLWNEARNSVEGQYFQSTKNNDFSLKKVWILTFCEQIFEQLYQDITQIHAIVHLQWKIQGYPIYDMNFLKFAIKQIEHKIYHFSHVYCVFHCMNYIHSAVQQSVTTISRTFSSLQTETLYPLSKNSPFLIPLVPGNL